MTSDRWQEICELLHSAMQVPPTERAAFLRNKCSGDPLLRQEVDSLLVAEECMSTDFLEGVPVVKVGLQDGTLVGPYRILESIGVGGMGEVYRATDTRLGRVVALKVLLAHSSMHPQKRKRFHREAQAISALQHPNISTLYDVGHQGETDYLTMELVEGSRIDQYCDEHRLTIRERLNMFIAICSAVQYAHQRLIVHCDIKPSNILVTAEGVPKLLDFGIAKILEAPPSDTVPLQTITVQRALTPAYASPEQAMGLTLTTATDLYSLGVLLYELLTGRSPYRVSIRTPQEMTRAICELEPERPSVAVMRKEGSDTHNKSLLATVAEVAARRQTSPEKLSEALGGDLNNIVLMALRKEPQHRYASAEQFAQDVRRHLEHLPVIARKNTLRYRTWKFTARHKAGVAAGAGLLLTLLVGIWTTRREATRAQYEEQLALGERDRAAGAEASAMLERDRSVAAERNATAEKDRARALEKQAVLDRNHAILERQRADTESAAARAINVFLEDDLLAQASANVQSGPATKPDPDLKVRTALDRAATRIAGKFNDQPLVEASIRQTIGNAYKDLGLYPEAQVQMERALNLRQDFLGETHRDTLGTMNNLAEVFYQQGKYAQVEALQIKLVEARRCVLGDKHPDTLTSMHNLALLYFAEGKYAQSEPLYSTVLQERRRLLGDEHPDTLLSMNDLALLYRRQGRYADAEPLYTTVLEVRRRVQGEEHPEVLISMTNLAVLYQAQARYQEAEPLLTQALEIKRRVLGEEHPSTLNGMNMLALLYQTQGKYEESQSLFEKVLKTRVCLLGKEHPATLNSMNYLASLYLDVGNNKEAESLFSKISEARERILGIEHPDTLDTLNGAARLHLNLGKYSIAETELVKVLESRNRILGPENPDTLSTMNDLARLYFETGDYSKAESYYAKVLDSRSRLLGPDHPDTTSVLIALGRLKLAQQRYEQAELVLREALKIKKKTGFDSWQEYDNQSLLGGSLVMQARFAEAELFLLAGYQGLLKREATIPWEKRSSLVQAGARIILLYKNWNKPEKSAEWEQELRKKLASSIFVGRAN